MHHRFILVLAVTASMLLPLIPAYAGDFTFVCAEGMPVRLPSCPVGCEVRLCQLSVRFVGGGKHKRLWHDFLFSNGMFFPKGGFVVYQPAIGACLIASTADDLDLISPLR